MVYAAKQVVSKGTSHVCRAGCSAYLNGLQFDFERYRKEILEITEIARARMRAAASKAA